MRITEGMLTSTMQAQIAKGQARSADASSALSSGYRIDAPSDDPVAAYAARRVEHEMGALEDMEKRSESVTGRLTPTEAALGEASDRLLRAHEIAITMANGTYTADEREGAAAEVRQIKESLLGLANTRVNGVHLFGGRAEDAPPFDAAGAYVGDPGAREVEVAPGLFIEATVAGDTAFSGAGGGVDVFAEVEALFTALMTDDGAAIAATVETLEEGRDQLTAARADVGARLAVVGRATELTGRFRDSLLARRRDLLETDVAETASELAGAQQVLEAAVSVGRRLMEPTLIKMLM